VDAGSAGGFGYHLCVAAFSSEIVLHQAEVDVEFGC
jgi:hypothetical protein